MWAICENGKAINLSLAHKIEMDNRYDKVKVYATFPEFAEKAILKTFESEEKATEYILELVNRINDGVMFDYGLKIKPVDLSAGFADDV